MRRLWMLVAVLTALLPGLSGCDSGADSEPKTDAGKQPSSSAESGGSDTESSDGSPSKTHSETKPAAESGNDKPAATPFCDGWEKPAVTFAVTGQMHGYMEPCGCADPQYGGISRRADLLRQLREKGWSVVPLELGGTLKRSREQSKLKFQTLRSALVDMKYEAIALGVEDLRMEPAWLLSHRDPDDPTVGPAFLCANITLFNTPELGVPVPSKIVEANGKKIGITAVFGPQLTKEIGNVNTDEIQITDPVVPLKKALAAFEQQHVDVRVLLSHATLAESRSLAKQFPEFDLVLSTGPIEDPVTSYRETIGKTTLILSGHKGKYVAVIGWYPDADPPFKTDLVKLDGDRFADPPEMIEHMKYYQGLLKDLKLAETEPAVKHTSGDSFVGAQQCGKCHEKAFAKWETTGHAKAFASIQKGRRNISRIFDPECLACHVTGWHPQEVFRYESGYLNEMASKHLLGNQCENCHGPGSRHIELIEAGEEEAAKKLMKVTKKQARDNVCYTCHDLDNSPHFDFDSYWEKVAHPWRD
ncbi:MAG: multiheme c-type cytochrome [Planctomycetota bacterium]|nr:multiheme c-type cytochrome [Planctomycetota bacterium]MDA1251335.1 multiheme c-type cytochrome [Planctomycetota bacterium]